jgi:hypothetical protein
VTGQGHASASAQWAWVQEEYPNGIRLTFVRGISPERITAALGADPADSRQLTAEVTYETLGQPWARVGRSGEWAFCIDNCFFDVDGFSPAARELSAGTELALLDSLLTSGYFFYFADGTEVTSFEPLLAFDRRGSAPDRFVAQMREVGLDVEQPPDDAPLSHVNPRIATLDMLTLAFGIRLSRDVALGPLATARPRVGA